MGDFNVGDIVQLKSGSPNMTISKKLKDELYCIWHDGDDFRGKIFSSDTVKKVYTGS